MATFAEYQAHTMAASDFTLYPYSDGWSEEHQPFLPTSTYADQPYLHATSFDPYPAYAAPPSHFDFASPQIMARSKSGVRDPSPAHSTSHSLEYQNAAAPSTVSDSGASVQSTISSAIGSPSTQPQSNEWHHQQQSNLMFPSIVQPPDSLFPHTTGFEFDPISVTDNKGFVDPSLIQPTQYTGSQFPDAASYQLPYPAISSPAPTKSSREPSMRPQDSASPFMRQQSWQPYPQYQNSRRQSMSSVHSGQSPQSQSSEDSNKGLCPIATCGRHVKDLKAHMLTHQNERPEKCPIPTCEYHTKGFARKYDKNRHTLTHYKGTMVCGFCPGSGSAAEKSFNRADVFKRHLTSVHGVEQTPPNARRKSPTTSANATSGSTTSKRPFSSAREVSGMCSTCSNTFASAQDFYEHLDDCVLRVVQQIDPSETINEKLLTEVADDKQVLETMEKNMLPTNLDYSAPTSFPEDDEDADEVDIDVVVVDAEEDDPADSTYGGGARKTKKTRKPDSSRISSSGAIAKPKKGLTYSKGGVPLSSSTSSAGNGAAAMSGKGSKRRKDFPLSWGAPAEQMRMRKRVTAGFYGSRRLWKDDMMLDASHEVRIPLLGADHPHAYVTDLDVMTMRRAEGFHGATPDERGPAWATADVDADAGDQHHQQQQQLDMERLMQ